MIALRLPPVEAVAPDPSTDGGTTGGGVTGGSTGGVVAGAVVVDGDESAGTSSASNAFGNIKRCNNKIA